MYGFPKLRPACVLALIIVAAILAVPHVLAGEPKLPLLKETWHPLAGESLHVFAGEEMLFVADFEKGAGSSSGPQVKSLVAKGIFGKGPFGRAMRVDRLAYPGKDIFTALDSVYFAFWLRLDFDPATDTQKRVIMQMGDGERNSTVMRTNGAGKLMLVLSDDDYSSAVRTDISKWKKGEWHHVGGWFHKKGHRLWLMVDGYGADSTIMYHNDGLTEEDLGDLYIGCGPNGGGYCAIDEVVYAKPRGAVAWEHHHWLLGIAQLAAAGKLKAEITPNAHGVAGNPKAVAGTVRTFGLECTLPRMPRVTKKGITADKDLTSSASVWTLFNKTIDMKSGGGEFRLRHRRAHRVVVVGSGNRRRTARQAQAAPDGIRKDGAAHERPVRDQEGGQMRHLRQDGRRHVALHARGD